MSPAPKHSCQEQEKLILEAAVRCIEESSLLDFTMSAIAKAAGLSIGSLYKHVQSKEDVLLALATQSYQHQYDCFKQILELPLRPPAQLAGVALRDHNRTQRFSFSAHLDSLASCLPILQRGSANWLNKMAAASEAITHLFEQYFINAIESGELLMDNNPALLEELLTGTWALCVGYDQVILHQHIYNSDNHKLPLPFPINRDSNHIKNMQRLLSSYPWQRNLQAEDIEAAEAALINANLR